MGKKFHFWQSSFTKKFCRKNGHFLFVIALIFSSGAYARADPCARTCASAKSDSSTSSSPGACTSTSYTRNNTSTNTTSDATFYGFK